MKRLLTIGALAFAVTTLSGCMDDGHRHVHSTHHDRHHDRDHHDHDWHGRD